MLTQPNLDRQAVAVFRALENARNVRSPALVDSLHAAVRDLVALVRTEQLSLHCHPGPFTMLELHLDERYDQQAPGAEKRWWHEFTVISDPCHTLLQRHILGLAKQRGDR